MMSMDVLVIPGLDNSQKLREARERSREESMKRLEMQRAARETLRRVTIVKAVKR